MTEKEALKVQADIDRAYKMGYTKASLEHGVAVSKIAERLGVSDSAVRSWKKKLEATCAAAE